MANIPLIIKAKRIDGKELHTWNAFTETRNYIKAIDAFAMGDGKLDKGLAKVSNLVSGIPTPWARPLLFKYAIESDVDGISDGLKQIYESVKLEWKALIAFIALYSDNIVVEKVFLDSDAASFRKKVGDMLFEDKILWTAPDDVTNKPFLQIIKYQYKREGEIFSFTVGATSPHSLVFTPPMIRKHGLRDLKTIDEYGNWKNFKTCEFSQQELQRVYDCVGYISENLTEYRDLMVKKSPIFQVAALDSAIKEFQKELITYEHGAVRGELIKRNNLFNSKPNFFKPPFDVLFNAEARLYKDEENRFYRKEGAGRVGFKIDSLLAQSKTAVEVVFLEEGCSPDNSAALMLKVRQGRERYFALPLSPIGLEFFEGNIEKLIGETDEREGLRHKLRGQIEETGGVSRLKVIMEIEFFVEEGDNNAKNVTSVEHTYDLSADNLLASTSIIVWPNFVREDWKSYYFYSELPHNNKKATTRAFPIIAEIKESRLFPKRNKEGRLLELTRKPDSEETNEEGVKIPLKYATDVPYEIYESEYPFAGVELRVGQNMDEQAGYLMARTIATDESKGITIKAENAGLGSSVVGIDFGSNNSCVSYRNPMNKQDVVVFRNRRRFLLGSDRNDSKYRNVANQSELLFFGKVEQQGQIKSMVVAHSKNALENPNDGTKKPIRGGFPMLEKNLPIPSQVTDDTSFTYPLYLGVGQQRKSELIHNMKWVSDPSINNYKYSFLKTMLLQVYAELFDKGLKPETIRWAYPSAMGADRITKYMGMWREVLQDVLPIREMSAPDPRLKLTEGEAVALYAMFDGAPDGLKGGGLAIGYNTVGIGYDVGGSTTDILLLMKDADGDIKLVKQSSILLAASSLAKAISRSSVLQQTLREFIRSKTMFFYGMENIGKETASYHLNAVFDRLNPDELKSMYDYFFARERKELFAIASYVSGLMVYYTGQLAAQVIREQEADINTVTQGFYGKGGNIFNWITEGIPLGSKSFYEKCFDAGIGKNIAEEEAKRLEKEIAEMTTVKEKSSNNHDVERLKEEIKQLLEVNELLNDEGLIKEIEAKKEKLKELVLKPIPTATTIKTEKKTLETDLESFRAKQKTLRGMAQSDAIVNAIKELDKKIAETESALIAYEELKAKENEKAEQAEKLVQLKKDLAYYKKMSNVNVVTKSYKANDKDNKREVSFGLSSGKNIKKEEGIPEIVGEEGYSFDGKPLRFTSEIGVEQLKHFGGKFKYPERFAKLEEFVKVYEEFADQNKLINVQPLREEVKKLSKEHFQSYIDSLAQYQDAKKLGDNFDFKSPMIILEGMCLLDKIILEKCLI